jgi:hypothetical protein
MSKKIDNAPVHRNDDGNPDCHREGLIILARMIARSIINQSLKNHEVNHKGNRTTMADIDG